MTAYLDASVLVTMLRPEGGSEGAADFISNYVGDLIVSDFGRGEVGAVVSRLTRTKEIDAEVGMQMLADFDEWIAATIDLVATIDADVRHAAQLVRRFDLHLRMPDAIHLASCLAMRWELATFDHGMANAARKLGIELAEIGSARGD